MAAPANGVHHQNIVNEQFYNKSAQLIEVATNKLLKTLSHNSVDKYPEENQPGFLFIKIPSKAGDSSDIPVEIKAFNAVLAQLSNNIAVLTQAQQTVYENLKRVAKQRIQDSHGPAPFYLSQLENLELQNWSNSRLFGTLIHRQVQTLKI